MTDGSREGHARLVFRAGAILNWVVTVPAIVAPAAMAPIVGLDGINYPVLLRLWAAMAFLWGCMFWEISRDPYARRHMIKYAWLEKSFTAVSVTLAAIGTRWFEDWRIALGPPVGIECLVLVVIADWLWILPFLYYDLRLRGNPPPENVLVQARLELGL